jgi:hypothetical protein
MIANEKHLNYWRENIFFYASIFTAAVFPFSEALVSISSGFLLLQAILLKSWKYPGNQKSLSSLFFLFSIFGIYLAGTIFTQDLSFALYELKKVIFWIVIPLAFFLAPTLTPKKLYIILGIFILSVFTSSLIFTLKLVFNPNNNFDVRELGFISHIRFSYQVILVQILLLWVILKKPFPISKKVSVSLIVLIFWLTIFLYFLKSLIGIIAFLATTSIVLIFFIIHIKRKSLKYIVSGLLFCLMVIPAGFIAKVASDYFNLEKIDPDKVDYISPSGNAYEFDFDNGARENGNLVYMYICHPELRKEWNKRSNLKYDDMLNGYPLSITLIRYLTSLGYRKDSTGVSNLNDSDIKRIEKGVTNHKFGNLAFSIYPRVYETIWEIDTYLRSGDPNNKSLAQRIEYFKASLIIISNNPWFGIGTGNWKLKFEEAYISMESRLAPDKRASSHNQYLNYLVKFGWFGFFWIFSAFLIPFFRGGHAKNFVFLFFLISIAFANFGDANLETHMGLSFFTFFYCLFLWNSPAEMKKTGLLADSLDR